MPEDGPALLAMSDTKLLGILRIICEVGAGQQSDRKFDSKTIQQSSTPSCKANTDWEIKSDKADVIDANSKHARLFQVLHEKSSIEKGKSSINAKNS